jgi:nucleoside-diphosphate-sugar epimerase
MIMGDGKNYLCLAYNKNTVEGALLAHKNGILGEAKILGNENLTFRDILTIIAKLLGKNSPKRRVSLSVLKTISEVSRAIRGSLYFRQIFWI